MEGIDVELRISIVGNMIDYLHAKKFIVLLLLFSLETLFLNSHKTIKYHGVAPPSVIHGSEKRNSRM